MLVALLAQRAEVKYDSAHLLPTQIATLINTTTRRGEREPRIRTPNQKRILRKRHNEFRL